MSSFKTVLLASALISVNSQDFTLVRTNHPFDSHYSSGYYTNAKFKPGSSFRTIVTSYDPSNICLNPNHYGFFNTQASPIPQPNIYYVRSNARPATSAYSPPARSSHNPLPRNNYRYAGNPTPQSQIKMGLNSPNSNPPSRLHLRSAEGAQQNRTFEASKTIKVTRPSISVKIIPPSFNENATSGTNITSELEMDIKQTSQNTRLNEKTRETIKKLLEMDSQLASKSIEDETGNGDKAHEDTTSNTPIGTDPSTDVKFQPSPRNEMVIQPNYQATTNKVNGYPLPKTIYGATNEPMSSLDRMKILAQFNPTD